MEMKTKNQLKISNNILIIPATLIVLVILGLAQTTHAQERDTHATIVPFKIQVPDSVLRDLKQRLSRTRFADEPAGTDWNYGTNLAYLRTIVDYWREKYNWQAQEKRLNEFEQFSTNIDGVDIHFIH
jgi:hypothetical protein